MGILERVEKLERVTGGMPRIFFCNGGESESECLERYGITDDSPGLNILIVKWASPGDDLPDYPVFQPERGDSVPPQDEAAQIIEDLKAEGMSLEDIGKLIH